LHSFDAIGLAGSRTIFADRKCLHDSREEFSPYRQRRDRAILSGAKTAGVRMTYALRQGTANSDMSDTFACEFQSAEPPFNLMRYCASTICYGPDDADADRKRRFGEMRILLVRAQKK
jgi:hypothetical protein